MARILYLTTGLTGMLNAGLELGVRLRARGHEVVFASHRDRGEVVTSLDLAFVHLTRRAALAEQFRTATTDRERWDVRRRSFTDTEVEDLVASVRPDLLMIDIELHVAIIVTRDTGVPTLVTIPWYSPFPSSTNPPLHSSLTPDRRAAARLAWWRLWAGRIHEQSRARLHRAVSRSVPRPLDDMCRSRPDLAKLARARGWPLARHATIAAWLTPHTYTDLDIVSYNPVEMEFGPVDHPRLHHVGPMVPTTSPRHGPDGEWRRFAARRDPARPLVYCAQGSMWKGGRDLLLDVIEVFRRRPEWDLAVGLGGRVDPASFTDVPDNAVLLPWAPQVDVLRHASAAIMHGGIGTLNECVANGVPMVAYSHGALDADGCVARLVHHGLGVAGDLATDGPDEIDRAIRTVLADGGYRDRCEAMSGVFDEYRTTARAELFVESRLHAAGVG